MSSGQVLIDKLLKTVIDLKAADLHISVGQTPLIRKSGRMRKLETKILEPEDTLSLMKAITPDRNQQELQERGGTDFAIEFIDGYRFRCAVFKQRGSIGMVLRRIPSGFLTFEQIGMPEVIKRLITRPRGLLLVTGPTGSGKSTTLAAVIDSINSAYSRHIVTVEEPIEFVHPNKKSVITQREVPNETPSFAAGLKAALREDTDVVLVGEMRDLETIALALTAAETGLLVFGTLHTNNARKTVDRIIDAFPSDQQEQIRTMLANSLRAVCAQLLLKRSDGGGRLAVNEILISNNAVAAIIREGATMKLNDVLKTGKAEGMQLMDDAIAGHLQ
ncbi:MAG: type IV pilus twitching motility protein PilT, partial [Planctomycetaceae bacterium]